MEDNTTIKISKYTKSKLDEFGKKGESYEEIIIRILIELNERRYNYGNRN